MGNRNGADFPFPTVGGTQSVAYTGTHGAITTAVGTQTRHVVVVATSACHIQFAVTPVATTADFYLPADTPVMLTIRPGQKVSAIQVSTGGTLYVSEMTY